MLDIEVSNTEVSDTSKKRKAKETGDVDGERRKKRKRTPHSAKKNKDKDMEFEVKPKKTVSADLVDDESVNVSRNKKNTSSPKKKSRVVETEVEVRNSDSAQNEEKVAKKKSKTKKALPDPVSVSTPSTEKVGPEQVPEEKSKKKKKEKDKYPDPKKDNTLSELETALKALTYVYERLTSHSEWKFNKARQNWILRNIWDENAIPEIYVPSCVKYLKGVQGNSRNVLIKECNSILEEDIKTEPDKTEGTVRFQEPSEPTAKNEVKISRAQAILKKLMK
ncbi:hypothetical protein Clacol_007790 [Clathrus columnatus]|uniref:WKF domain-containing protein n=1 Tax=Clathrus columnatus TaxID=1419009 RepID=A0AAV5AM78_9AGAM|nr:hypothetical protein Clacol_007790 [Clathrus columnatus]